LEKYAYNCPDLILLWEMMLVVYRLRSEKFAEKTLNLTSETWSKILRLAEEFGWRPVSQLMLDWREQPPLAGIFLGVPLTWHYDDEDSSRQYVVLEDAYNLADILEQALYAYDPIQLPVSFFYFENRALEAYLPPSIGALSEVIQIARLGAFWIESDD
jgi:hypothetical protein